MTDDTMVQQDLFGRSAENMQLIVFCDKDDCLHIRSGRCSIHYVDGHRKTKDGKCRQFCSADGERA